VLSGWEGSVSDSALFEVARQEDLAVPEGKFIWRMRVLLVVTPSWCHIAECDIISVNGLLQISGE
jgi:hypothetical protein